MTAGRRPRCRSAATRAVAGGGLLVIALSLVATAPSAGATDVTFAVDAGPLSIVQPTAAVSLGRATQNASGASFTGSLGTTTINDSRGVDLGWTSTVAMTAFTSPGGASLPASSTKAFVPTPPSSTGTVMASAGPRTSAANGVTLSSVAQTLVTGTLAVGVNSATFAPSVTVTVPGTLNPGTYTAVVTQTVS